MTVADVERGLIARYMVRILSRKDLPVRGARHILFWLNERADGLSLPLPSAITDTIGQYYGAGYKASDFERALQSQRQDMLAMFETAARETTRPEPLATNLEHLTDALGLPRSTVKIVGLIACCQRFEQILQLGQTVLDAANPTSRAISYLVDEPARVVEDLLAPSSDLIASGLLQLRDGIGFHQPGGRFAIPQRVSACLDRSFESFADLRVALLGEPLVSPVGVADYDHVAKDRDMIAGVLRGAAAEQAQGVNILIHGPPGSGKTELTKVAAAAAGLTLFSAGEHTVTEGDRSERLADLVFAQRLLGSGNKVALLFDEMEDVAVHLIKRGGSKVYLNRLLEKNPIPIIWTSNELYNIDPAVLRRMTCAVELKRPPASQRKRILAQLADRVGLVLSDSDLDYLARRVDATPAIIENALRAAKFAGGGVEMIERAAVGIVRAVSGVTLRKPGVIPDFDPELACASQDLGALADKLVAGQARNFTVCLSGPPGTGKSAYARYVARRLGMELLIKRASDILDKYVGGSEKNIAAAFEEAKEADALLVFDEADSLLLDRTDATRSWEITQVNEMLTWMEEHPLPVFFTTNLMDRIDKASLRRFTFHIAMHYLDPSALQRAWVVFFGMASVPPEGLIYQNLTPGDFAKARKQAEMLSILDQPARLVSLLGEISRAKPGARGAFGFTT
jgi:SpoVK/Ycf46/Vps4 family AAA+-type ATPase